MLNKQLNYLKAITKKLEAEGILGNMVLKQWKIIVDLIESTQSLNLDKPTLINKTETEIGKITSANFRKRISMLNQELEDEDNDFGIKIDNSKSSVIISINEDKVNKADEQKTVEFIKSRHAHDEIDDDKFVVPKAITTPNLTQRQVLFSYSWESDEEELAVQRKFAEMLESGLKSPPAKYKDTPKISLFIDHKGFEYGEHQTEQQDRVCSETPIAVICYTQKYLYSEACMREVDFYLDRDGHNLDNRRAIVMPFDCSYSDMDERFQKNLAITPPKNFTNGLDFFSSACPADKKELINQLVENIYKWFQVNPNPPKYDRHHVEKKTLQQLGEGVGQDHQNVENLKANRQQLQHEGAVDIVQTMFDWATGTTGMETRLFYLLGDFGAGKSTSCQMLTNELMENYNSQPAKDQPVLPIYLDLKKLLNAFNQHSDIIAEPITSLIETMLSTSGINATISGADIIKFINEYPCLLIFDGFDEVGQKLNTQQQTGLLNKLLDIFPKRVYQEDLEQLKMIDQLEYQSNLPFKSNVPKNSRILISCRTHFFKDYNEQEAFQQLYYRHEAGVSAGEIKNYQTYYLLPFTKEQIKSYLVNWLGENDADKAITFINTVHDLSGLSERPLMLNLIRDLLPELQKEYEQNKEINASTLYKLLFDRVQHRDNEKHLIPIDEKRKLLSRFALHMWQQGVTTLNVEDLDNWFLENRYDYPKINIKLTSGQYEPETILQDLHNASLLVRDSEDDYRFAHTSFLEFFVAVGVFDSVIDCKDTSQGFDSIFKRDDLSREIMQFLLDWRVSHRLKDKFDKNWQLLQQADSSTSARQIALNIWYLGYANQQSFTTLVKPNWHGLKLYKLKLDKQSENNLLDLSSTNLSKASVEECDFSFVDLSGSDFTDAHLRQNTFEYCNLENIKLELNLLYNNVLYNNYLPNNWEKNRITQDNFVISNSYSNTKKGVKLQQLIRETIGGVNSINCSTISSKILIGTTTGASLWQVLDNKLQCLHKFAENDEVQDAQFSPDDSQIILGTWSGASLWQVLDNKLQCLHKFAEDEKVQSTQFSPDGMQIILGTRSGASLWQLSDNNIQCLHKFVENEKVQSAQFSPDGSHILLGTWSGASLWQVLDNKLQCSHKFAEDEKVQSAHFSPDGMQIILGTRSGASLWQLLDNKVQCLHKLFVNHSVQTAQFSPDGGQVLLGTLSGASLWEFMNNRMKCLYTFAENKFIKNVQFISGGRQILLSSWSSYSLWQITDKVRCMYELSNETTIQFSEFVKDEPIIIFSTGSDIKLLQLNNNKVQSLYTLLGDETLEKAKFNANCLHISIRALGRAFICQIYNNKLYLLHDFKEFSEEILNIYLSSDGSLILLTKTSNISLWKNTGEELKCLHTVFEEDIRIACLNNDNNLILLGTNSGASLWEISSDKIQLLHKFAENENIQRLQFSTDGRLILLGSDTSASLWEFSNNKVQCLHKFSENSYIKSVEFSSSTNQILLLTNSGASLWEYSNNEIRDIHSFKEFSKVFSANFNEAGNKVILSGIDYIYIYSIFQNEINLENVLQPLQDASVIYEDDTFTRVRSIQGKAWKYLYNKVTYEDGSIDILSPDTHPDWEKAYQG